MNLNNVVWLDCETTGIDIAEDRVIELGMIVMEASGERKKWCKRFYPGLPIKPEAIAVHGITDADVANEKPFSAYAPHIHRALSGKHLAGYNLKRLDLPIIDAELRRSNLNLDLTGLQIIDCAAIFFKREPRALADAVRKYCGREHEGKHGAAADAEATLDVFLGQMVAYPDLAAMDLDKITEYARLSDRKDADLAGKLAYDDQGRLCFAFGKHKGEPCGDHPDYCEWMINATRPPFPGSTVDLLREFFAGATKAAV